jgi:hypothetical protein
VRLANILGIYAFAIGFTPPGIYLPVVALSRTNAYRHGTVQRSMRYTNIRIYPIKRMTNIMELRNAVSAFESQLFASE